VKRGGDQNSLKGCSVRAQLEALRGGATVAAEATAGLRTRANAGSSALVDATPAGGGAAAEDAREPLRLDQLPTHAAEVRVAEDPDLAKPAILCCRTQCASSNTT